ncbi:hypothetical protein TNCV_2368141 [Trichonephila clavipes]|nr:hypothetical protein TNCV_2368141 [Trichonephila clavipes]
MQFLLPLKPPVLATPTFSFCVHQSGSTVSIKATQHTSEPQYIQYGTEECFAFQFPNDVLRPEFEDDQRSGIPISSRTPEIIEKVRNFAVNDHYASLKSMEDSLSTNNKNDSEHSA